MAEPELERRVCDVGDLRIETRGVGRVIRGYAIVFNRLSEVLGFFREKIMPEAIDRTFSERADLRALVDHDSSKVLGRITAGTLRVEKDAHGLQVEIDPPDTTSGHDIVESIRRRDITGMSFAFLDLTPLKDRWDETTDPPTRIVRDMLVREVSIVTFPAYPQTEVALRSLEAFRATGRRPGDPPRTVSERMAWSAAKLKGLTGGRRPV
jgi:HK97 family phage prohead protease